MTISGKKAGKKPNAPCRSELWPTPCCTPANLTRLWTFCWPVICSTSAYPPPLPRELEKSPFWVSTMGESLLLAAMLIDAGFGKLAAAVTSSHFCTAERQYRAPLEYGGQRPPTAQWTVTGSGCVILSDCGNGAKITHATVGKIVDKGITDANNMGAAMAPAAYDTLCAHFRDTGRSPSDYDLIATGDLGKLGHEIVRDFFARDGIRMNNYTDCGMLIYDLEKQDVHCGGSGCGCAASVLTGYLLPQLETQKYKRILFCPTGALLSPTSTQQGESIPSICHAISIEM